MFGVFSKNGTMLPKEEYEKYIKLGISYGTYGMRGMDNSTGISEVFYVFS